MSEVKISYDHPWQHLHWESLCIAYRSSPYFEYYEDGLEPFYKRKFELLMDFNTALSDHLASLLNVDLRFDIASEYHEGYDESWTDLRDKLHPNPARGIQREFEFSEYRQVFSPKLGFIQDLSIFDLLFHKGPASPQYLKTSVSLPPEFSLPGN